MHADMWKQDSQTELQQVSKILDSMQHREPIMVSNWAYIFLFGTLAYMFYVQWEHALGTRGWKRKVVLESKRMWAKGVI